MTTMVIMFLPVFLVRDKYVQKAVFGMYKNRFLHVLGNNWHL